MTRILTLSALILLAAAPAAYAAGATSDLGSLMSNQVARCWNPPANSTGSVTLRFDLTIAGSVVGTPVVSGLASMGVAAAAQHAVSLCQPYHLPPERFSDWQHVKVKLTAP